MNKVDQLQSLDSKKTLDPVFVQYGETHKHMETVDRAVFSHNPWKEPISDPDASALKKRAISMGGAAPISPAHAFARAHGKEAPIDLAAVAGIASSAAELQKIEQLIEMIQSTPSEAKKPRKTVRSAQAALMEAYATIRPLISELRFLESERMHKKMAEIQESVEDEVWYQSLIGTTYGLGFAAQAAILIGGPTILGAETQNAAALASYVQTAVSGTTSLEQSYMIEPQHKKSVFQQTIAMEKEKQRSMGELEKEMKQMVLQLLQLRAETTRRAASAAGG